VLEISGQDGGVVFNVDVSVVFCYSQFVWLVQSDTACCLSQS
jgi:hypothetical protein